MHNRRCRLAAVASRASGDRAAGAIESSRYCTCADNADEASAPQFRLAVAIWPTRKQPVLSAHAIPSAPGAAQSQNAIQIQSKDNAAQLIDGIKFNFSATEERVMGTLFYASGSSNTAQYFLRSGNISYSVAEIDLPSLLVQ